MSFSLTNCQENAIERALIALKEKNNITISGPAGSGKSFLTKVLIQKLRERSVQFVLCAPTHQAKLVLAKMSGYTAVTIHSLLKIHPETYEDQREFKQTRNPDLSDIRVVIVDEASMIDDDLYKILMNSIHPNCIVIGIGDKAQIQPVKHMPGHLSPFFTSQDVVYLTEVVRQQADNPIIQVASEIRQGGWFRTNWKKESGTGVIDVKSPVKMMEVYLKKINKPEDLRNYRLLAYTNDVVNKMNKIIRKHVYDTTEPFVDNEFLVMQEPVLFDDPVTDITEILLNNGETVKIKENSIVRYKYRVDLPYVDVIEIEAARMIVERQDVDITVMIQDVEEVELNVVWGDDSYIQLHEALNSAAAQYKQMGKNAPWKQFWNVKNQFIETKSLGASTIHKSQGTTVDGCGVCTIGMNLASMEIQEQLAYVAVTRAQKWVMFC